MRKTKLILGALAIILTTSSVMAESNIDGEGLEKKTDKYAGTDTYKNLGNEGGGKVTLNIPKVETVWHQKVVTVYKNKYRYYCM